VCLDAVFIADSYLIYVSNVRRVFDIQRAPHCLWTTTFVIKWWRAQQLHS